jgi:MerR family redox-sensitive transcriptional activator SoxR
MEKLRDELTGCIGCGCLSLRTCRLINRDDVAAVDGAGSYLLGD